MLDRFGGPRLKADIARFRGFVAALAGRRPRRASTTRPCELADASHEHARPARDAGAASLGDALSPLATRLQGDGVEEILDQLGLRLPTGALASGGASPQALQASAAACAPAAGRRRGTGRRDRRQRRRAMIAAAATLAQRIVQAGAAFTQLGVAHRQRRCRAPAG